MHKPTGCIHPMTRRQRRILHLVAEGYRNEEIAEQLRISSDAVRNDQARAMRALNIRDVSCLVDHALRTGVIDLYQVLESRFLNRSKM